MSGPYCDKYSNEKTIKMSKNLLKAQKIIITIIITLTMVSISLLRSNYKHKRIEKKGKEKERKDTQTLSLALDNKKKKKHIYNSIFCIVCPIVCRISGKNCHYITLL